MKHATLDGFLHNNGIDTLVLMGFATHICVESTLRETHDMGLNGWVVSDGLLGTMAYGQDNRAKLVRLTPEGRGMLTRILPGDYRLIDRFMGDPDGGDIIRENR